ncbi:hypothetical protein F183_A49770 [Bryobacterales bacterium F-183]|nr:hypothetical protein F183_A49770 [Bryobacterales bacterium F-183]
MRAAFVLAFLVLLAGCGSGSGTEDLQGLPRPQRLQQLKKLAAQNPGSKEVQQQLGDTALEEGDAKAALAAFEKTGDAKGAAVAKLWTDPAQFPTPQGSPQELYAAAMATQLAVDSPFSVRSNMLNQLNRAGRLFFDAGNLEAAGACVQRAKPIVAVLLQLPEPSLYAMHLAAEYDNLYGDMLFKNRHWGNAREFFQNNVMRFRSWDPPNEYTKGRLEEARRKVAECEKRMLP